MLRTSLAMVAAALLTCAGPAGAASSPAPAPSGSPSAIKHKPAFSASVRKPSGGTTRVSAAACNRRAVGLTTSGNTMGPNGASNSNTLIAIPIGGGSVSSATEQHQITEACAHQH